MKWTNKRLLRLQKWTGNVPKKETGAIYGWNVLKDTEFENFTRTICRESKKKLCKANDLYVLREERQRVTIEQYEKTPKTWKIMDKYASTLSAILRYIYKFVIEVPALRKKNN